MGVPSCRQDGGIIGPQAPGVSIRTRGAIAAVGVGHEIRNWYGWNMTIEVGQPAPAFALRDKKREEVTLDSFPGKHLVLAFYPLAFTGG